MKYSEETIKSIETIQFSGKCSDMFSLKAQTKEGETVEYEGNVPHGLGIGGGDYIKMKIDLKTGQILNWKEITEDTLLDTFYDITE